ncbi:unnamed protein product [Prorocentrum cordatum]|uniref:SMB domain-containing protein n=1 Tax=Prorocentrum cordatum TaxID=2364126 RepID=A0ABN9SWV9_9DINO|nr:unnamed protein product [Polarella glacialis]
MGPGGYAPMLPEEVGDARDRALQGPSPPHAPPDASAKRTRCQIRAVAVASAVLLTAGCAGVAAPALAGSYRRSLARSQLRRSVTLAAFDCAGAAPEAWPAPQRQWCCEVAKVCAASGPAAAHPAAASAPAAPCAGGAPPAPKGLCAEYGCGEPAPGQGCHCHPGCAGEGTCCGDYDAWCIAAGHAGEGAGAPEAEEGGAAAGGGGDDGAPSTTAGPLQDRLDLVPEVTGKAPPRPSPPVTSPVRGTSPRPASCPEEDPSLPKLYCFSIAQAEVTNAPNAFDELALIRKQFRLCGGVFGCTHYAVFSDRALEVGPKATSWTLPTVSSSLGGGASLTATWVNTEVFKTAWQTIIDEGTYLQDDFVVKADPDAVLVPTALQDILHQKGYAADQPTLFRNCPGGPRGLELFGSLEVVSRTGLSTYAAVGAQCQEKVENAALMGEDMWLQECMDAIGVQSVMVPDIMHDAYCSQDPLVAEMCIDGKAAYHPFKVADEWAKCFGIAVLPAKDRPKPRSDEDIAKVMAQQEEEQAKEREEQAKIIAQQQAAIQEQQAAQAKIIAEQQEAIQKQQEPRVRGIAGPKQAQA